MVKKHLLILNWQFPPNTGIGGRRSAKLAKEWKNIGHEISVLTRQTSGTNKGSQSWINKGDIEAFDYFFIQKKNTFNALYFKTGLLNSALLWFLKKWHGIFTAGNPIDDCRFSGREIAQQLENIHKNKPIDLLFVSCAPFSLSVYAGRFKKLHPEVLVWCDFRDPWKNAVNYGLQLLNNRQLKSELRFHQEVPETIDFISAPYQGILSEFDAPNCRAKKVLIPHFTDREINELKRPIQKAIPEFIYAGNLYEGSLIHVLEGVMAINQLKKEDQPVIHFIGDFDLQIQQQLQQAYDKFQFTPWMNTGLEKQLESCDGLIIILSEHNQHFHTTKFYDFLPLGKPYLYIGPKGEVHQTIVDHNLGCSIEQYNVSFFDRYQTQEALRLARKHTATIMAKRILSDAFQG